jgi:hypothetical protein
MGPMAKKKLVLPEGIAPEDVVKVLNWAAWTADFTIGGCGECDPWGMNESPMSTLEDLAQQIERSSTPPTSQ